VQRPCLGLGELLVVDRAGGDEALDDRLDRGLDAVHDRRLGDLGLAHAPAQHPAQALGGRGIALEVERRGVLQVLGRDRSRRASHDRRLLSRAA